MARGLGRFAVLAVVLVFGAFDSPGLLGQQRRQESGVAANFAADGAFTGSSLTGWRPVGGATWRAENGEIIATTGATGGWLIADKPFEDVSMVASFRCTGACQHRPAGAGRADRGRRHQGHLRVRHRRGTRVVSRHPRRPGPRDLAGAAEIAGSGPVARRAAGSGDPAGRRPRWWRRPWAPWSAADARRHSLADCAARQHRQGRRVEHHRSGARRQHRARLPERRRRHPRRRGRRRVRRVRGDRALCRRRRRGAVPQGRLQEPALAGACPPNTCRASSGSRA